MPPVSPPSVKNTPNHQTASYRLLYRGSLSLPDSHILLDGLTFAVKLESPSKSITSSLLENQLALALESMRGRPSLRLLGVIKLADVYMDGSGSVEMDIHPPAVLSRIYFENIFCLKPSLREDTDSSVKSDIGVKIALGDSDGLETTQIVVFAQLSSVSPNGGKAPTIQFNVARLTLRPTQRKAARLPRPDDPIPRKPPIIFGRDLERVDSREALTLKRVASGSLALNGGAKRVKLLGGGGSVSNLGNELGLGPTTSRDVFKVPELPKQVSKKGKEKVVEKRKEDVFGGMSPFPGDDEANGWDDDKFDGGETERLNKNTIKKATIAHLAQTKDPSKKGVVIDKHHPDFKEFYGTVYRGVCFAVRGRIRLESADPALVDRLLKIHTRMYLTGLGPPAK